MGGEKPCALEITKRGVLEYLQFFRLKGNRKEDEARLERKKV